MTSERRMSGQRLGFRIRDLLTDDEGDVGQIAKFAGELGNVQRVDVLPFHQMGQFKWKELGLEYALDDTQRETVLAIRNQVEQIFRDVLERGARLGAFANVDPFLDTKAIGAMAVRLPEWWTPDSAYSREQIIEAYSRYALNLVN